MLEVGEEPSSTAMEFAGRFAAEVAAELFEVPLGDCSSPVLPPPGVEEEPEETRLEEAMVEVRRPFFFLPMPVAGDVISGAVLSSKSMALTSSAWSAEEVSAEEVVGGGEGASGGGNRGEISLVLLPLCFGVWTPGEERDEGKGTSGNTGGNASGRMLGEELDSSVFPIPRGSAKLSGCNG